MNSVRTAVSLRLLQSERGLTLRLLYFCPRRRTRRPEEEEREEGKLSIAEAAREVVRSF